MYLRVETDYKSYDYQCTNRAKLTPAVNGQMQVRICNTFKHANSTLFPQNGENPCNANIHAAMRQDLKSKTCKKYTYISENTT